MAPKTKSSTSKAQQNTIARSFKATRPTRSASSSKAKAKKKSAVEDISDYSEPETKPSGKKSTKRQRATGAFGVRKGEENGVDYNNEAKTGPSSRKELSGSTKDGSAYGQARAKSGWLNPIHRKKEPKEELILRVFDLSDEYGPCIGVTRLERWERAQAMGLEPPKEVFDILKGAAQDNTNINQCVFYTEEL